MKTIYKYELKVDDEQILVLPKGSTILTVQSIDNIPYIWVLIDLMMKETENRHILMYKTGGVIDVFEMKYIGTYQVYNGNGIFHTFESLEPLE